MTARSVINAVKKELVHNKAFYIAVLFVIAVAAFLRFYKLDAFVTFLGDQGRDAITMKRIVTLEDFPGIGPRSSMGQIFLGPFYYYFMAPFLLLFHLDPIGPAFGVALLAVLALGFFMIQLKRRVDAPTALLFGLFVALSYVNIWLNRFSWNPNLLPTFAFFTLYFLWRLIQKPGVLVGICFGFFLAGSLQLHYLMLFLGPVILAYVSYGVWIHRKQKITLAKTTIAALLSFGVTLAPLILFDLKNNFLNLRGFFTLLNESHSDPHSTYYNRLNNVLNNFLQHVTQIQITYQTGFLLLAFLVIVAVAGFYWRKKMNQFVYMQVMVVLSYCLIFGIIDTERYQHYFTPVYFSLFVIVAYCISLIKPRRLMIGAAVIIVSIYGFFNYQKYWFLTADGNYQTKIAGKIADTIISMDIKQPYYMVSIPLTNTNDHIRYYLEIKNKTPAPEASSDYAEQMVILCYETGKGSCNVYNDPQYQIVKFGDRKVAAEKAIENVRIFKLIHAK